MLKKWFLMILFIGVIALMILEYVFVYRPKGQINSKVGTCTTTEFNKEQDYRIEANFYVKDVWTEGYSNQISYNGELLNNTNKIIDNWKLEVEIQDNAELGEYWGVNCILKDNILTITPDKEYESKIGIYSKMNFGFILSSISPKLIDKYTLYINDELYTGEKRVYPDKDTPVYNHGRLTVAGPNIIDKNGEAYILQGVSTHGIAWYPEYITKETFKSIRDDLNCNAVRIAMYSDDAAGYSKELHGLMSDGINYATELGLYVIIDWAILDDNNPNDNKDNAIAFFEEMAREFKDYDNIIYEICNEPNGNVTWDNDIKPYAKELIEKIRAIDDDGIIVVGTPNFSQDVDVICMDQLEGYSNIVYAFHFYSATHKADFRQKLQYALDVDMPILVTEFGTCEADGNGKVNLEEADIWIEFLRKNKIGYFCWNLTNKSESSSLLSSETEKTYDWDNADLSESGLWLKEKYDELSE